MPPLIRKIEPGDVIGRCRIIRELGRGGVGTVYLATHETLKIEVAIKILSPSLSLDNPALGERFIREAQLAARIRHPNVIAVMDAAHDEGSGAYFIVMEYVGGGSLAWHLRNGPLPEIKALGVVIGIAQALVVAEENRVVHRDIKPENIMLDTHGTPKLADLGLAKHVLDTRTSITIGGSFMGTPAYMSPEQARDAKVADTRDDIYSLGASFYECLTGLPPFQGETPYNIMSELLTKPSPCARDLRPELLESTDLVCRKMMAKNRDLRYATARDLVSDLLHVRAHGDQNRERMIAAPFEHDEDLERRRRLLRESKFGIETSADGVYAGPVDLSPLSPRPGPDFTAPRRHRDAFRAAALLVAVVVGVCILLAWADRTHPLTRLRQDVASTAPATTESGAAKAPLKTPKAKDHVRPAVSKVRDSTAGTHAESVSGAGATEPPGAPSSADAPPDAVPTSPVALPVTDAPDATNFSVLPAVPADAAVAGPPPESAFTARDVAEKSLDASLLEATGHAPLLRIIGKRDPGTITPTTWTIYFYDKTAAGNARIVTVTDGKVLKSGEDLVDAITPYTEKLVLPEGQLLKDSSDVLPIAQGLVPDDAVTSSDFVLMQQRNSVPLWKVTLWGKTGTGDERKLGDVTLLAESGFVLARNVKP